MSSSVLYSGHRTARVASIRSGHEGPGYLATSSTVGQNSLALALQLYTQRIQIKEGFRAIKSRHYGLGVEFPGPVPEPDLKCR